MSRVAVLGSYDWHDQVAVKAAIKALPAGTVVLLDDDPFDVQAVARRQCRCSQLVAVVHCLPATGARRIVETRAERDRVMLEGASRAIVFGKLAPDRALTLAAHEKRGLQVERRD